MLPVEYDSVCMSQLYKYPLRPRISSFCLSVVSSILSCQATNRGDAACIRHPNSVSPVAQAALHVRREPRELLLVASHGNEAGATEAARGRVEDNRLAALMRTSTFPSCGCLGVGTVFSSRPTSVEGLM